MNIILMKLDRKENVFIYEDINLSIIKVYQNLSDNESF